MGIFSNDEILINKLSEIKEYFCLSLISMIIKDNISDILAKLGSTRILF